jgi:uncharacterized membrane-anchored protein YitT (DUF2179 family)
VSDALSALRHGFLEDAQALLVGTLLVALSVVFLRHAGLLTGGTAGIALLVHYATGMAFGLVYFLISIPFYIFAVRAMGWEFTVKTFVSVALLSIYSEWLPHLFVIGELNPVFAAVMGGLLAGVGLLMLFRHHASLGGIGIVALVLQRHKGWRAGKIQMAADGLILAAALFHVAPKLVLLSVLGAGALNLVIAINHRPGRYFGT